MDYSRMGFQPLSEQREGEHEYDLPPSESGEYRFLHSVLADRCGQGAHVTDATFDSSEELLWISTSSGHMTSYHRPMLQKYTSFQVHPDEAVEQIASVTDAVLALTSSSLRCFSSFGKLCNIYSAEGFRNMSCMLQNGSSTLLVGGSCNKVHELDIPTMKAIRQIDVNDAGVGVMRFSNRFTLFGEPTGKISFHDMRTLRAEQTFQAHSGGLSDFDVHGNQIVTCGLSQRVSSGNLSIDRYLMVFDMRVMRAVTPVQCPIEPYFVKYLPTYTDRVIVVSPAGDYNLLETGSLTATSLIPYHARVSGQITAFDISSSQKFLVFGDGSGCFSLHMSSTVKAEEDGCFNTYSSPTVFPEPTEEHPFLSINDVQSSYASLAMPYPGHGGLLSDWPSSIYSRTYRQMLPIDVDVLKNMKMNGAIGYAPSPPNRLKNQVPYLVDDSKRSTSAKKVSDDTSSSTGGSQVIAVPKRYKKVEIVYSKLGVEDFDFTHYNKTNFAGLETHIPNAYCNCMLQVFYFIEPLRSSLLNHVCQKEFCLACELHFLFHMLDISKGKTCQGTNFLRAFRTIPEASGLGLNLADDVDESKSNLTRIIQSWGRFVLQQVHAETCVKPPEEAPAEEVFVSDEKAEHKKETSIVYSLFSCNMTKKFICRCGEQYRSKSRPLVFDLTYPEVQHGDNGVSSEHGRYSFAQVLSMSINSQNTTPAWCGICSKFQPHVQQKLLESIPDIFVINCQVDTDAAQTFWKCQLEFLKRSDGEKAASSPASVSSYSRTAQQPQRGKPCRYGHACTRRKDCRYRHDDDSSPYLSQPSSQHSSMDAQPPSADDPNLPHWVPLGLAVKLLDNGSVEMKDMGDPSEVPDIDGFQTYELLASVALIKDRASTYMSSLVSLVNVGKTYHQRKERVTTTQTYLFNDFSIVDVEKKEAAQFNTDWKLPCVLFFAKKNLNDGHSLEVKNPITADLLYADASRLNTARRISLTSTPLDGDEVPKRGDIIGLDAEFVSLNEEEAELHSDGTRLMIKPSQMFVARISCLRGPTAKFPYEPFLDDYIATQEAVVDYLTQFSGIKPDDLDATKSSKHLTTLKSTYQKLRHLADIGVVFVGHGLKKDFRVINLVVPKEQVVDTVDLFRLPRQRMISLKFLAWYFLGEAIQSDSHDSVEDARTALKLYTKYQELVSHGKESFNRILQELYEKGRTMNWRPPEAASSAQQHPIAAAGGGTGAHLGPTAYSGM